MTESSLASDATCVKLEVSSGMQVTGDGGGVTTTAEPCPFCLSRKQHVYEVDADVWAVYCAMCKAIGPHAASIQDAVARWEQRS